MSKVDIKRLDSVTNNDTTATKQINDNFQALQQAVENTISRDGTVPNYMDANFDLNSYRIINAGDPVGDQDVVTLKYFEEKAGGAIEAAAEAKASASKAASSAQAALVASNNAIGQLAQAEGLLTATEQFVDAAKADINTAVSNAESTISTIVSDAEGSITNIAVTEANKAIANAAQEATDMAKANVNSYVDGTVKPSLQTYVDQAQENANSAATSMEQAASSATAASNYASNASASETNALSSKNAAASSATAASGSANNAKIWAEGTDSEVQGLGGVHSSKVWSEIVEDSITTIEGCIGDIGFAPLGIDETQNRRRYLNGQVISQTQFVSFTNKVKSAIALYPNLVTTEENWQVEKTNSKLGQCGKFVIDDTAGTIRLPKVVNINGLTDLSLMGGIKAESLPDATYYSDTAWDVASGDATRSLVASKGGYEVNNTGKGLLVAIKQDATSAYAYSYGKLSASNSVYQDNAPVQQEAIQYPYFIQVATGSEESVDVSTEIQLNNPFFFGMHIWSDTAISNASWLISNGSYHSGATYASFYEWLLKIKNGTLTVDGVSVKAYGASDITDYDFVINTADTTFRLPVKVKLASGNAVVGNGMTLGLTDNTEVFGLVSLGANWSASYQKSKYGSSVGTNIDTGEAYISNKSIGITTDPSKSGIETSSSGLKLYFYVGETIQDANVIVASQVLTTVADCVRKSEADYVVESYNDGTSWYRLYKSGWIEQGGFFGGSTGNWDSASITYLKPFKDTTYQLYCHGNWSTASSSSCTVTKKSTTGATITYSNNLSSTQLSIWLAIGRK